MEKKNHAVSWEVVRKAKFYGGIRVGLLRARSAALQAKWVRFWEDNWSRGGVLKEVFPRLFNLRNLNELEIAEVARLLELLEGVSGEGEVFSPYTQIWKAKTPPKVKIFVWQAVLGKLNTGESMDHLLLHCPFSLKLWETLLKEVNMVWAVVWNLWLERNRRIFEDYKGV
ncbi:unnamed protein product, partial [Prunus brigantina]